MIYIKCTNCFNTVITILRERSREMINLNTSSHEPLYLQIQKQIIKLINLGVYESNCALPSVRAMAYDLGINPNTVARAYKSLEEQGIIYTIVGKGVFVSANNDSQIKTLSLSQFEKAVKEAKNDGINKEEALSLIEKVFGGGEKND